MRRHTFTLRDHLANRRHDKFLRAIREFHRARNARVYCRFGGRRMMGFIGALVAHLNG